MLRQRDDGQACDAAEQDAIPAQIHMGDEIESLECRLQAASVNE
jgi:hypothetical protein